jgi:hypothetical protein
LKLLVGLVCIGVAAVAQSPKTKWGKADFSGIWLPDPQKYSNVGEVSLLPAMQKVYQQRSDGKEKDPVLRCLPTGVPRITKEPMKIMQTPDVVVMIFEGGTHSFRQFHIGRAHPTGKDWENNWMGHSNAVWDGDTLVVDTVGQNDLTWLNDKGLPHSEQLHVVERYSRPDAGHLNARITMEDPGAFAKPVTFDRQFTLVKNREIREYSCTEGLLRKQGLIGVH